MTRVLEDEVYTDIAYLVMIMSMGHEIIFVSGRDISCQNDTEQWIQKNIKFASEAQLVMRKN